MTTAAAWMSLVPGTEATEVVVCDTDALLGDACDTLATSTRSSLLRAIDVGVVAALMSQRAYLELGWMYPKAARGRGVDETALHELIEAEYLPRIRVVTLPTSEDGAWAPLIDDVADLTDMPHAQLARLVAPSAIYSHDKHLRTPGYAPKNRDAYAQRLVQVAAVTQHQEAQLGVAIGVKITSLSISAAVEALSGRVGTKPAQVWVGLFIITTALVTLALQPPERRRHLTTAAVQLADAVGGVIERSDRARLALSVAPLVRAEPSPRLESQLASFLSQKPDSTITEIREAFGATAPTHAVLNAMLNSHPSFTTTRPFHWALGCVRTGLAANQSAGS